MKKRTHKNTPRLTARERAGVCVRELQRVWYTGDDIALRDIIQAAIASAVSAALARKAGR